MSMWYVWGTRMFGVVRATNDQMEEPNGAIKAHAGFRLLLMRLGMGSQILMPWPMR